MVNKGLNHGQQGFKLCSSCNDYNYGLIIMEDEFFRLTKIRYPSDLMFRLKQQVATKGATIKGNQVI